MAKGNISRVRDSGLLWLIWLLVFNVSQVLPVTARERPLETVLMMDSDADADDDDDDDPQSWEHYPNPNPLLSSELVPGFTMQSSRVSKGLRAGKPPEFSVSEEWARPPLAGSSKSTFIRIQLYPTKNKQQALKAAGAVYRATNDPDQSLRSIGKPNPGSFSGAPIGDWCWAFVIGFDGPRKALNDSSSLVVVNNKDCFKIQVTGSGDSGQGVEDKQTEKLAKELIRRLKDWPRPQ